MRLLKLLILAVVIFVLFNLPLSIRYSISDWFSRFGSPTFSYSIDSFDDSNQSDLITYYKNGGFELECYGGLRDSEKIGDSDYLCFSHIGEAYDNIPARMVTFFFSKNKLAHVRIAFAPDSYQKLNDFLDKKLEKYTRLDQRTNNDFGTDNFGKPLKVWAVKSGIIVTSAEDTRGQSPVVLWSKMSSSKIKMMM